MQTELSLSWQSYRAELFHLLQVNPALSSAKLKSVVSSAKSFKSVSGNEDLDLTGSPLKCSFTLEETLDESFENLALSVAKTNDFLYVPLATKDARLVGRRSLLVCSSKLPFMLCRLLMRQVIDKPFHHFSSR